MGLNHQKMLFRDEFMIELEKNIRHLMINRDKLSSDSFNDLFGLIMSSFPDTGWELGPYPGNPAVDVLSLTSKQYLSFANEINGYLSLPIIEDDWVVVLGRPPRDWQLYFRLIGENNVRYEFEGKNWFWKPIWTVKKLDLEIFVPENNLYNSGVLGEAIDILLVGELGDLNVAQYVGKVTYSGIKKNVLNNALKMSELRREFVKHFDDCHYSEFIANTNSI